MRKLLLLSLVLLFSGCSLFETPEAVYKDLNLVKENILIQKRITDTLLEAVQPQNDKQVEALAMKKLDVEQRFDRMASGLNRVVTYYQAEREVGYLINVLDFMQESRLRGLLLSRAEREDHNEFFEQNWTDKHEFEQDTAAFANQLVLADYHNFDRWMLRTTAGRR